MYAPTSCVSCVDLCSVAHSCIKLCELLSVVLILKKQPRMTFESIWNLAE